MVEDEPRLSHADRHDWYSGKVRSHASDGVLDLIDAELRILTLAVPMNEDDVEGLVALDVQHGTKPFVDAQAWRIGQSTKIGSRQSTTCPCLAQRSSRWSAMGASDGPSIKKSPRSITRLPGPVSFANREDWTGRAGCRPCPPRVR